MISCLKKIFIATIFTAFAQKANAQPILRQDAAEGVIDQADIMGEAAGFNNTLEIGSILSTVIATFLSLMGIVFLILIVLAGYRWMTANGEEKKVTEAQDTIKRAIIGLIIIIAAYAITAFVFNNLDTTNI